MEGGDLSGTNFLNKNGGHEVERSGPPHLSCVCVVSASIPGEEKVSIYQPQEGGGGEVEEVGRKGLTPRPRPGRTDPCENNLAAKSLRNRAASISVRPGEE